MKLTSNSILETDRLILKAMTIEDVAITYQLRSNLEVRKYMMQTLCKTIEQAVLHVEKIVCLQAENKTIVWVIYDKNENKKIGTICLWNFSEDRKTAELGYDLLPQFFNKGFMSEALQAVITFAKKRLHLVAIEAFTHQDNSNSIKLLKKFNFVFQPDRKDEDYLTNSIYVLSCKQAPTRTTRLKK